MNKNEKSRLLICAASLALTLWANAQAQISDGS